MGCDKCGAEIKESAIFCENCGTKTKKSKHDNDILWNVIIPIFAALFLVYKITSYFDKQSESKKATANYNAIRCLQSNKEGTECMGNFMLDSQ